MCVCVCVWRSSPTQSVTVCGRSRRRGPSGLRRDLGSGCDTSRSDDHWCLSPRAGPVDERSLRLDSPNNLSLLHVPSFEVATGATDCKWDVCRTRLTSAREPLVSLEPFALVNGVKSLLGRRFSVLPRGTPVSHPFVLSPDP